MNRFRILRIYLIWPSLCLLMVGGCKSSSEVQVRVTGEPDMRNATRVRIYQLSSQANFETARFVDLFRDDDAVLGAELLQKEQVQIFPDQAQTLLIEPSQDAQYIGVAADVREPEGNAWRTIHEVRNVRGREMVVIVGTGRLLVEVR